MISQILTIIATIILFLFAIHKFSQNMQRAAGDKLKYYLTKATETPLRSTLVGGVVNAVIQSNTALTLTLIGLVNASLITLPGALGVIIGSNIGSSLTSQLVAFNVIEFGPIFIVIGFLMRRLKNPIKHYSSPVFYFGLMFLSLSYLQLLITPYSDNPAVLSFISHISSFHVAIGVGLISAAILQSSTAVSILAITLAARGILTFDQAYGLVAGAGAGATATALIVSFVMNASAQRTAIANLFFNIVYLIIVVLLFEPIKALLLSFDTSLGQTIANTDLFVSVFAAIVLLLGFKWYVKLTEWIIPNRGLFHKTRAVIETKL